MQSSSSYAEKRRKIREYRRQNASCSVEKEEKTLNKYPFLHDQEER
jgi:hypothetical protein